MISANSGYIGESARIPICIFILWSFYDFSLNGSSKHVPSESNVVILLRVTACEAEGRAAEEQEKLIEPTSISNYSCFIIKDSAVIMLNYFCEDSSSLTAEPCMKSFFGAWPVYKIAKCFLIICDGL